MNFEFDVNRAPQENIEAFLQHLEAEFPQLTVLLREALKCLLPLPEPGADRNTRRREANRRIIEALDSLGE